MEIKEIRVGQIVLIDHDTITHYKVLEIKGGKANICELLRPEKKMVANISNLILLVNS
jgi:hypothetical protein